MAHTRKILWRGRMRWTPDGVDAWTHDGQRIRLGRHALEKTRKIADEMGYYLSVPDAVGAEHGGCNFGAEQVATSGRAALERSRGQIAFDYKPFAALEVRGASNE